MPGFAESHLNPFVTTTVKTIPSQYHYLVNRPVAVAAVAEDIHEQDDNLISEGVYQDHIGEIWGADAPRLDGISLDTGRNVSVVFEKIGTGFIATDDWLDPLYTAYGILFPNSTAGIVGAIRQKVADTGLRHQCMVLRRGIPPVSSGPTNTNCYTYLEFFTGGTFNIRLAMEYARPVRLQITTDSGATWNDIKQGRKLSNTQDFFHLNNECLVIKTFHDVSKNVFALKLASGITLFYKPDKALIDLSTLNGRLKVIVSNGWCAFTMFYNYHRPITAKVQKVKIGAHTNAALAFVQTNALVGDTQTVSTAVTNDGFGNFDYSVQVSKTDDSGASLGSSTPPRFSDGTLILPGYWDTGVPGGVNPSINVIMKSMRCSETQVWDDTRRVGTTSGVLYANNYLGTYTGGAGVRACKIEASIDGGSTVYTRLTGVEGMGGTGLSYENPTSGVDILAMPFMDKSALMGNSEPPVTLGYDVQMDGWCLFSAVRFFCEIGNIHTDFLTLLPDALGAGIYYPPGAPATGPGINGHAPYGPADSSCPYPILGRGVGDSPLYVFGREMTPWQCLQRLVAEQSFEYVDPISGLSIWIPYMMYFDNLGFFHFEPYHPGLLTAQLGFTDDILSARAAYPGTAWFRFTNFTLLNSVSQMRTDITFQSIDALSNELLQAHLDMPTFVKELIGYYSNWIEGSSRWADQDILNDLILTAGAQCALVNRQIAAEVSFISGLFAGQRVSVRHKYLGSTPIDFYINVMSSEYGAASLYGTSGHQVNTSQVAMRAVENF